MVHVKLTAPSGVTAHLFNGDCFEVAPRLRELIPDAFGEHAPAIISDPPYLIPHIGGGGCFQDSNTKVINENTELAEIINDYDRKAAFDAWVNKIGADNVLLFCSNLQVKDTIQKMEDHEMFYTVGVWNKFNACPFTMNTWMPDVEHWVHGRKKGGYMNNDVPTDYKRRVKTHPMASKQDFNGQGPGFHLTAKPVAIMQQFVSVTCRPGGLAIDPFMGSGSTGVAAVQNGRNFVGIEKRADYFDLALSRMKREMSQKALF